jgi:ribosome-associated protein
MIEFKLREDDEYIALCDLLKATGLCESGALAKHVIADGLVQVDEIVDTRKRRKVRSGERVTFQGKEIKVL